jgi:hypothetical protein
MDARNVERCTQPIMMTRKFCIGILASAFVIGGGGSARASVIVVDDLYVSGDYGQTQAQQQQDLYECDTWATGQTGFDPSIPGGGVPPGENATRRTEYRRAMTACLEARGYTVRMAPPPPPVAPDSPTPPQKWEFIGRYQSPIGRGRDNAVIDLTSSYNLDYVVHYMWVGGGFVQQDGQWAPGPGLWAFYNLDIDCKHHTFKERRFINHEGSFPASDDKWIAIKDGWQPMQLAEKRVCSWMS